MSQGHRNVTVFVELNRASSADIADFLAVLQKRNALLEGVHAAEIADIPKDIAEVLITAHEITPDWHVRMQAAFQETIDNGVSKTVNLPSNASIDEVDKIY